MRYFIFYTAIFFFHHTYGQVEYLWDTTYGGSQKDEVNSLLQSPQGDFYIIGNTFSSDFDVTATTDPDSSGSHDTLISGPLPIPTCDMWIVKLDSLGKMKWQNALGGTNFDVGYFATATGDNGVVIVGSTGSTDGDIDPLTDPDNSGNHRGLDLWVVKLDSNGIIQWQNALGGSLGDIGSGIIQTKDRGYAIIGLTSSIDGDVDPLTDPDNSGNHGESDLWVVKLDSIGVIQWQNVIGGSKYDRGSSIIESNDNGYILSGITFSSNGDVDPLTDPDNSGNHGGSDLWVVKLDATGNILWQNALGGSAIDGQFVSQGHGFAPIIQNEDSTIIVAINTESSDGDLDINNDIDGIGLQGKYDYWVLKLNKNGEILWSNVFGGIDVGTNGDETVSSIVKNGNCRGYVISGDTYVAGVSGDKTDPSPNNMSECAWSVWIDENGYIIGDKATGSGGIPSNQNDENAYIISTNDGKFALAISSANEPGYNKTGPVIGPVTLTNFDYWFVLLDLNFEVEVDFDYRDTCFGSSVFFNASSIFSTAEYKWDMGVLASLSDTSNEQSPKYIYPDTGYYDVQLILDMSVDGLTCSDTIIKTIHINSIPEITDVLDSTICKGDSIKISVSGADQYIWTPFIEILCDSCDSNIFSPSTTTQYILQGINFLDNCSGFDTFNISVKPLADVSLGNDKTICKDEYLLLNAYYPEATYLWQDNSIDSIYLVTTDGVYYVQTNLNGCEFIDSINIRIINCSITKGFPQIFTPNGDGINDLYLPFLQNINEIEEYIIYNRWGKIVFATNNLIGWDGTYESIPQETGIYLYRFKGTDIEGVKQESEGIITLLR